jgi:SAM-dependent methyltransferase
VLLVGAGNQRAVLTPRLAKSGAGDAEVVAIDVDARADVDVVADAHALPFIDGSFDAVVVTAVIEHVLRAEVVMAEIVRVLRPGGLLYSEVPFVQQVHEGALDFTRYTLSGHRLLAREFEELESGATAGPATALVWALEHFALALVDARTPRRRAVVKAVVRGAAGWLKWLDRIIANRPAGLDGASCTYFYGRLGDGGVSDESIVAGYRGAQ